MYIGFEMKKSPSITIKLTECANKRLISFMMDKNISRKTDAINYILERWI